MKKLFLAALILLSFNLLAADKTIYLTSLDWPPYTGEKLKDQGASAAVAKAAFAAMGYNLVIEIFSWTRAVNLAKSDPKYVGYFPEYYSTDIEKEFIFSAPMGQGPLGFVERKDSPVKWSTLSDLEKYIVGVVKGYVNTEEFDKKVADKKIKTDISDTDATAIKKVITKRTPLAVVDKNVFEYLLLTEAELKSGANDLQFNEKVLENKDLFICFKKNDEGKNLSALFNEGLKKIDVNQIMTDYLSSIKK